MTEAGGLERIVAGENPPIQKLIRNDKPNHIKLVAFEEDPGMQKYRFDVITNERDHSKLLNRIRS